MLTNQRVCQRLRGSAPLSSACTLRCAGAAAAQTGEHAQVISLLWLRPEDAQVPRAYRARAGGDFRGSGRVALFY